MLFMLFMLFNTQSVYILLFVDNLFSEISLDQMMYM